MPNTSTSNLCRAFQPAHITGNNPELQGLQFDFDEQGLPMVWQGSEAEVYRVRLADGRQRALRILRPGATDRAAQYGATREYLRRHPLPGLVEFCYLPGAVCGDRPGTTASVVLMDWVSGVTLDVWVDEQARQNRGDALLRAAELWHDLVRGLAAKRVVHGDLEPGNVLVQAAGGLTLIDYDCLAVPAQMGQANVASGTMPYQHPERTLQTQLFAELDNFSALTIYTELRAIAAEPRLRSKYSATRPRPRLLFKTEDFSANVESPLFRDLFCSPDDQVRDLVHYLREVRRGDLDKVPTIEEALLWCHSLDGLLAQHDFDQAAELVTRMGPQERLDQGHLTDLDNALERVACRRALAAAMESGDITAIKRAYLPDLLVDYPAAAATLEHARRTIEIDRCLNLLQAAVDLQQWGEFMELWRTHAEMLFAVPKAQRFQRLIDDLGAVERLESLIDDPASDDAAIAAHWQAVYCNGEPPSAARLQQACERRVVRRERFEKINDLIATASRAPQFAADQELRNRWKEAEQSGETRLAVLYPHYRLVKHRLKRLRWLDELTRAPTLMGEQQIAACSRYLPHDYHPKLPARIRLAQRRLEAVRVLQAALIDPISERTLAMAGSALMAAQGGAFFSEAQRDRYELARRRIELIDALTKCRELPPQERDRQVLDIWNETLPIDCPDAAELRYLLENARGRLDALTLLRCALENSDRCAIERLLADSRLAGYRLPIEFDAPLAAYHEQVRQARLQQRHALVQSILDHDCDRFRLAFDYELVAELCVQVPQHQRIVATWTEREVLSRKKSGIACGPLEGVQWIGPHHCRLRWTWPTSNVTNRCQVTVTRDIPSMRSLPEDLKLLYSATLDRDPQKEAPVVELDVLPEWHGATVSVWIVIDLGFQTFYGEPLTLDQLRPPDQ